MSSPHLGGDFLNALNAKRNNTTTGSRAGSGRNTPINTGSPHRPIPAQLASPYGRGPQVGTNNDDEDDEIRGLGWRPITPSRSPRIGGGGVGGTDGPASIVKPQRGPSSRNPDGGPDDSHLLSGDHADSHLSSSSHDDSTASAAGGAPMEAVGGGDVRFSDLPPVLKGYLLGQIACVIKFGVWWVGFTYLILALFGGSSYLVGGTRICFNLALLLCSPMAGGIAEKTNIKKLLNKTVIGRGLIYCIFIPVAWVLMDSEILWGANSALHTSFFVVFLLIIFIDGIGVSFSNISDIDSGGVNLVAAQYGIEIDDNVRNYFNSLHIMFFDLSMVIFNPLIAYLGLLVGKNTVDGQDGSIGNVVDELTLLIAIGGVFFISTVLTLICYNSYMPDLPSKSVPDNHHSMQPLGASAVGGEMSMNNSMSHPPPSDAPEEPDPLSWAQFKELAASVKEGAVLTWGNTRIRWRVLFFAVETSVEDAMIALIAAEIGSEVLAPADSRMHYAYGNLWGAGLVACGKCGGVLASMLMHRFFSIDSAPSSDPSKPFRPLFWFAFLGGCFSLLIPLSYRLRVHDSISHTMTSVILFGAMFLFFLFSTLSKIGFSTLMQSMAGEIEATGRVFGFVAAFVTATDALILMGMSALFSAIDMELALWISCSFIAVHGLIELVFGPGLVLKPAEPSLDEQLRMDLAQPLV